MNPPLRGTDMARAAGGEVHVDALEAMLQQVLIILVARLGGTVRLPVSEIDTATKDKIMLLQLVDGDTFELTIRSKS